MQRLSNVTELYPTSYELGTIKYNNESNWVARGAYSDVYKAPYGGKIVCIKEIKPIKMQPEALLHLRKVCDNNIFLIIC